MSEQFQFGDRVRWERRDGEKHERGVWFGKHLGTNADTSIIMPLDVMGDGVTIDGETVVTCVLTERLLIDAQGGDGSE